LQRCQTVVIFSCQDIKEDDILIATINGKLIGECFKRNIWKEDKKFSEHLSSVIFSRNDKYNIYKEEKGLMGIGAVISTQVKFT